MSISVVLYCYKNRFYFEQSLVTLLNQEECDWEAIVINDGGFLDVEKLIPPQFESRFNHIRLKKPVGLLSGFLVGISAARNKYGVLLRGWDFNSTSRLKKQLSLISTINSDSIFSSPCFLTSEGKKESVWHYNTHPIINSQKVIDDISNCSPSFAALGISCIMFDMVRVEIETLHKYNRDLRNRTLRPSISLIEKILIETLLGRNVYLHKQSLVTVNCNSDIEFFEKQDKKALLDYHK